MGRSLRRAKKSRPRARVGVKKKSALTKAPLPTALALADASLATKLPSVAAAPWRPSAPVTANYAATGVAPDANARFGRNARGDALAARAAAAAADDGAAAAASDTDDDLRAASGRERRDPTRRAAVGRLTPTQRVVVEALVAAHGRNVDAMARDVKRNRALLPASKLRVLLKRLDAEEAGVAGGRHGFRVPTKRLW
jgi:hypothetical protein